MPVEFLGEHFGAAKREFGVEGSQILARPQITGRPPARNFGLMPIQGRGGGGAAVATINVSAVTTA